MADDAPASTPPHEGVAAPADIAVALSGGGNRATLFALGVLLYLVDTGLNRRVAMISSVSGGSITNGFIAQECDFARVTPEEFDRVASALLDRVVRQGLFHGSWLVASYLAVLVCGLVLAFTTTVFEWPVRWPVQGAVGLALALAALALLRGTVISMQLTRRFFSRGGEPTRLADLPRSVEHVYCATDLTSGAPFYFSNADGGYVYSPALGRGNLAKSRLAGVTLATAVRASAAFPGGIPPKRLVLGDVPYEFRLDSEAARWQVEHTRYRKAGDYRPRLLFLADGGVWNNLGTQGILEHHLYRAPGSGAHASGRRPSEWTLVVVNASAPMRAESSWRLHLPIVGELATLKRSINTLNSNTVDPRIVSLRERSKCTVVSIADVRDRAFPHADIFRFKHLYPDDADLQQMNDDLKMSSWSELRLLETPGHESLAWHCSALPTTLGRVGRADALRLLMHGYQNALGEYFAQGGPRPRPSPDRRRFTRLIATRGRETDDLSVYGKIFS